MLDLHCLQPPATVPYRGRQLRQPVAAQVSICSRQSGRNDACQAKVLIEKAAFRCFEGAQGTVFVKSLNGMPLSPPERRTPFFGASKRQRFLALKSQRHVPVRLVGLVFSIPPYCCLSIAYSSLSFQSVKIDSPPWILPCATFATSPPARLVRDRREWKLTVNAARSDRRISRKAASSACWS